MQEILLVGLSHKSAPLEVRESVSFLSSQILEALPVLKEELGEAVILSTCNRSEIYTVTDDAPAAIGRIHKFVAEYHKTTCRQYRAALVQPYRMLMLCSTCSAYPAAWTP